MVKQDRAKIQAEMQEKDGVWADASEFGGATSCTRE